MTENPDRGEGELKVNTSEARRFLEEHHRAVLVTRRANGALQTSPVTVGVDASGRAVISATEGRAKTKNLRRDPRATLCVMSDEFLGRWMQLDGTATVLSLPDAMEPLIDYYRRVAGKEHPDWEEYRQAMQEQGRCLLIIEIERVLFGGVT